MLPNGDAVAAGLLRSEPVGKAAATELRFSMHSERVAAAGTASVRHRNRWHWLQAWLPKTMTGLVAAGCLLAGTPLVIAVVVSGFALQKQAHRSEELVSESLRLERLGAQLLKELENLERGGLQYIALEDPALLPVIERRRGTAEELVRQIESAGFADSVAVHTHSIALGLADVATAWTPETADVEALSLAVERMHGLADEVQAMIDAGRAAIDDRVRLLQNEMSEMRRATRLSAFTLIPLAGLLAWAFSVAVTRPLHALRAGIVALGTSNYRHEVSIAYPREMSRLGEKLDWLRRRLLILEADKERFLRHVSHELKTPLASMREGSGLLTSGALGSLNPRQSEVVQILYDATVELETQIRNLLAYAEWRDGHQRRATQEWFDARPMIEEVVGAHKLPLAKRNLQVALAAAPELQLYGQRPRLRVALDNLLSNAIKHAPPGSTIEIGAGRQGGVCRLSVRDYGRGIPASERQRVLEPFVRGSEQEESTVRGTGVGLSIVVETVYAHGGDLEIQDAKPGACVVMAWSCPPLRS